MPNFHLAITLTQKPLQHAWMGLTGRISTSMLHMVAPDLMERSVYVCGPEGFMDGTRLLLEAMKFPMQNYQEESFGRSKKAKPAPREAATVWRTESETAIVRNGNGNGNGHQTQTLSPAKSAPTKPAPAHAAPMVHFLKAERQLPVDDTASILELAEQEGIQIRHACRVGACGACKVHFRQGSVRYDTPPAALSPADKQAGYALACVAYPQGALTIDA